MTNSADPEKPTDLDLHCLLRQGMTCLAREGLTLLAASRTGAMSNPQWLELPMARTNFHGGLNVLRLEKTMARQNPEIVYGKRINSTATPKI